MEGPKFTPNLQLLKQKKYSIIPIYSPRVQSQQVSSISTLPHTNTDFEDDSCPHCGNTGVDIGPTPVQLSPATLCPATPTHCNQQSPPALSLPFPEIDIIEYFDSIDNI